MAAAKNPEAEAPYSGPTVTYAPWQLQEVRRQLRAFRDDVAEGKTRAAKMSGLGMSGVDALCEIDDQCKAIVAGAAEAKEEPQQEIPSVPKQPGGNS